MTVVKIQIQADLRVATRAADCHERIAAVLERELREIDSQTPTLGRPGDRGPAEVTHCYVQTEHGYGLGRAGRGDGWGDATSREQRP